MINLINRFRSLFAPVTPPKFELNLIRLETLNGARKPNNGDTVRVIDEKYAIDVECIWQDGELIPKGCE